MTHLQDYILLGGVLHFGILLASASVPNVLDWRRELKPLSNLSRQLIWTHGAFIVVVIIGFGLLSLVLAPELAEGTRLARGVCGFISLFWFGRLLLQLFVVDAKGHLTKTWLKLGYHGLTIVFTYFAVVYGYAAFFPRGA